MLPGYAAAVFEGGHTRGYCIHRSCNDHINGHSLQAFLPLGAVFGGLVAWPVTELLGRKPALMIGGVPAITGWLFIVYARLLNNDSTGPSTGFVAFLLLGRLFTGFATGWSIFCVSVSYILHQLITKSCHGPPKTNVYSLASAIYLAAQRRA